MESRVIQLKEQEAQLEEKILDYESQLKFYPFFEPFDFLGIEVPFGNSPEQRYNNNPVYFIAKPHESIDDLIQLLISLPKEQKPCRIVIMDIRLEFQVSENALLNLRSQMAPMVTGEDPTPMASPPKAFDRLLALHFLATQNSRRIEIGNKQNLHAPKLFPTWSRSK